MTLASRAAMDFISALDRGRLGQLSRTCAPGATWWVDSGPDRLGGDPAASPHGSGRFPLHGVMTVSEKLDLMRRIGREHFPNGCRQVPRRVIAGERDCVVEVEGLGVHASGKVYENRYGFVFDVDDAGSITNVREYLDTIHAHDVVGAGAPLPPRTRLPSGDSRPEVSTPHPTPAVSRALALWPALAAGDVEAFASGFADDATFWTDSGRNRERGRLDGHGDARINGPFHGRVSIADKIAVMRERIEAAAYASPGVHVTPHRVIQDGPLIALEASGEAVFGDGGAYQNRYLWVLDVDAGCIRQVREYCDTLHIAELMGYRDEWTAGDAHV